jgi:FlaA1/EpsC-like NDP-sugar epimerase
MASTDVRPPCEVLRTMTDRTKLQALRQIVHSAIAWPRTAKKFLMVAADLVALPAVLWVAITLRLGSWNHGDVNGGLLFVALPLVTIPVLVRLGLYRAVIRFISSQALVAALAGVTISTVALLLLSYIPGFGNVPRSSLVIYWSLATLYVGGSRYMLRLLLAPSSRSASRVVIYGAGTAGARLAQAMLTSSEARPVAFVDDDRTLWGAVIGGLKVHRPSEIEYLRDECGVDRVLLAMPSASRSLRRAVLERIQAPGLRVQTVPDISDILAGNAELEDVRDVDANDLLGREPVAPIQTLFDACIRGKVVMVTGAGGSIGSELCRQIAGLGPRRLVLFEMSEVALYRIEHELNLLAQKADFVTELIPLLGNAHHLNRMTEIMQAYGVQTVYHAAAYKHVPIVEQNVLAGIHNNVMSTLHAAEAARASNVETFVLVSTDKAVNPTNVMGLTKRFAEMVLQGLSTRAERTKFCMVRFGNVLESSGSVVPLFREQIRRGGPVTVTHPDIIRYFMTIPEATQLVLQAGALAKGGDLFVLDMGKPVKIDDLARRMISLSGLTVRDSSNPQGDVEIQYTGLRPAEKLYEELLIGSNVTGTEHPMILRALEPCLPWARIESLLADLKASMAGLDVQGSLEILTRAVREYTPASRLSDLVWSHEESRRESRGKVASLAARRPAPTREVGAD